MIQESMKNYDKVSTAMHGAYSTLPILENCSNMELLQLMQSYQNLASICLNQLIVNHAKAKKETK